MADEDVLMWLLVALLFRACYSVRLLHCYGCCVVSASCAAAVLYFFCCVCCTIAALSAMYILIPSLWLLCVTFELQIQSNVNRYVTATAFWYVICQRDCCADDVSKNQYFSFLHSILLYCKYVFAA